MAVENNVAGDCENYCDDAYEVWYSDDLAGRFRRRLQAMRNSGTYEIK